MVDLLISILGRIDVPVTVAILVWLIVDERRSHRIEREGWQADTRELIDELFSRLKNGGSQSSASVDKSPPNGKPKP